MRLMLITTLVVVLGRTTFPQIDPGAKQISLSHSGVALSDDVFSLFNNPAGLSQLSSRQFGLFYSPSPFGIKEMATGCFAYAEPFPFGALAIGGMSYGFELYKETKISAGFSFRYLKRFFAGLVLNYHTVSIKNYGTDKAFYADLGGLAYFTEKLRLGFYLRNLNRASFGEEEDQIPVLMDIGLSYDITKEASINFAAEKELLQKFSLRFGINYNIYKFVSLRTGVSSEPSAFSAGIGINYLFFRFDYAVFTHQELGLTHQAGVIITFN